MPVTYQDYYQILGVPRTATAEEIKKAYRKLARQYHPDVSKSKDAEDKFKRLGEAYEVLKNPASRQKYDTLGANWKAGQDFTPPPGWEPSGFGAGARPGAGRGGGGRRVRVEDLGGAGFSDFFETLFGGRAGGARRGGAGFGMPGDAFAADGPEAWPEEGQSHEAEITVSLEDAYHGATKALTLTAVEADLHGQPRQTTRTYQVKIPPGTTDGSLIRLAGQGGTGRGGGQSGDLFLHVRVAPHPQYQVQGHDLLHVLPVTPWEAALGGAVTVPTLDGPARLNLPAGTSSGQRLRLRGKGLSRKRGLERGDLLVDISVVVPPSLTVEERQLFQRLAEISPFKPRGDVR